MSHYTITHDALNLDVLGFDTQRYEFELVSLHVINNTTNILWGMGYFLDQESLEEGYFLGDPDDFYGDGNEADYESYSAYGQFEGDYDWGKLTAGVRYEYYDLGGDQVVPRFTYSLGGDDWYIKAVYNEAFRFPNIQTAALTAFVFDQELKPEHTTDIEFEIGYYLNQHSHISLVPFWLKIKDLIAFDGNNNAQLNAGDMATIGLEMIYQTHQSWGNFVLSYSYYKVESSDASVFDVAEDTNQNIGISPHKITASSTISVGNNSTLNLNAAISSSRYACTVKDPTCVSLEKLDEEIDLGLFFNHHLGDITLGAGLANLLNEDLLLVQPYRNDPATATSVTPLPGLGRRLMLNFEMIF